jgi:ethanolamine ammonia-lyase small subunit
VRPLDPWAALRRHTAARIGLGRAGTAVPTAELVGFGIAHAMARDAVWTPWEPDPADWPGDDVRVVRSAVRDRSEYLRRPDLGRRLADGTSLASTPCDVAVVVTNGLSSTAVVRHGPALVRALQARLGPGPVVLVRDGRVAIGDPVGHALGARAVLVVVGERPGLSSADGLGIYVTFDPRPGTTDERRNCVSNVRPDGLPIEAAADKAAWLVRQALTRGLSGIALKDESQGIAIGSADVG